MNLVRSAGHRDAVAAARFSTAAAACGGERRRVVRLVGEIDLVTAPVFGAVLRSALEQSPQQLVVDMSQVMLLSAAGITMLIETKKTADDQGAELVLVRCSRQVRRTLEMTDLYEFFSAQVC